jgi:hypothetical protein
MKFKSSFYLLSLLVLLLIATLVAVSWQQSRLTPESAEHLLQQAVDTNDNYQGNIEKVELGFRLCGPQDTGFVGCRVDVSFILLTDSHPRQMTGYCVEYSMRANTCQIPTQR